MTNGILWFRRHPLLGYFTQTYGISWGGILVVLGFPGFDLTVLRPLDTGLIFGCMLLGPSIAGLTMTAVFPATSFKQGLAWQTALAFALWLAVAVVIWVVGHRGRAGADGEYCHG